MYVIYTTTQLQIETFKYLLMWLLKILLQINSNSLVIEQKQKQTNKQTNKNICLYEYRVSKLNGKIKFYVLYNGYEKCLDKSPICIYEYIVLSFVYLIW